MRNKLLSSVFLLTLTAASLSAAAAPELEVIDCNVLSLVQSKTASGLDLVQQVNLENCTGIKHSAGGDFIFVWAPQAMEPTLKVFLQNKVRATFTVTQTYAGTLLAINGNSVGSLTPMQDRMFETHTLFEIGTPGFDFIKKLLDGKNVNKDSAGVREVTFKGVDDPSLVIRFRQNPFTPPSRHYGSFPENTLIYFEATHPVGKLASQDTYFFTAGDSRRLYAFFNLADDAQLRINLVEGTAGSFECANVTSCKFIPQKRK